MSPTEHRYVLITPAKDEAAHLRRTVASVERQTVRPREWVIVSDGSTDGTNEILAEAAAKHPWIRPVFLPPRARRDFAAVVRATETGLTALRCQDHQFIGLLDADLEFQPDYFQRVLQEFAQEPSLGLAGGVVIDVGLPRHRLPFNRADVPGAVQFFRRACFEELGGLFAVPEGGWDALTCVRARMLGYDTRLLTSLVVDHLKPRNVGEGGPLRRKWQHGLRDHALGNHPLFEAVKCLGKLRDRPYVFAALAWWLGFCYASLRRRPRTIPRAIVRRVRDEQIQRLFSILGGTD